MKEQCGRLKAQCGSSTTTCFRVATATCFRGTAMSNKLQGGSRHHAAQHLPHPRGATATETHRGGSQLPTRSAHTLPPAGCPVPPSTWQDPPSALHCNFLIWFANIRQANLIYVIHIIKYLDVFFIGASLFCHQSGMPRRTRISSHQRRQAMTEYLSSTVWGAVVPWHFVKSRLTRPTISSS